MSMICNSRSRELKRRHAAIEAVFTVNARSLGRILRELGGIHGLVHDLLHIVMLM